MNSPRALLCLLSGITLLTMGCQPSAPVGSSAKSAAAELPKVVTVKPERKTLVQRTEQPGQIEAFRTTPILAKVAGYVERMHVDIGDRVQGPKLDADGKVIEPGQLLVELQAPELDGEFQQKRAMVEQADAEVEQAEAAVKVARSAQSSAVANVDESQAGLQRVEAMYQRWKSEFDRVQELAASKAVTQKLADETEQQFKSADAARSETAAKVRSATAKQQEAVTGIEKAQADLKAIKARAGVARADQDRVAALCDYLKIRAPFSGVITARNIDQGVLVQPARSGSETPLFMLVQAHDVRLFVSVPDSDAVLVEPGRNATVKVPALGAKTFTGRVTRTGWALQAGTRTLNCEIDVPNPDGVLRPGMYAHVELVVAEAENALALPKAAVIVVDGKSACMTVSADGVVSQKLVEVGLRTGTDVQITSGLDGDEDVISANPAAFKDGQRVTKAVPQPSPK